MIKVHLSRLMGERKLKISDVARATGLNRNTIRLLYYETASRVDLDAINRLCQFFDCQVGDLLEFVPDEKSRTEDNTQNQES
ncbi:XRE family transcriptional regulator [Candidatus Parcubacteria bacterium]|nr:MAG: XRE family transcriptional regulator [Candidatus Parcubacteria bacterium]